MDSEAFVYCDRKMTEIAADARKAARGPANILIEGPAGSGRSTLARYIHACSGHHADTLTEIHCAAGARPDWLGEIAAAGGAVLLLVDVCELGPQAQAELALALGSRGGGGARVIASASHMLERAVRDGSFREDLFYRLGVVRFRLPSLTERPHDLPLLAAHFAARFAQAHGRPARRITAEAISKLAAYHWPGNVQELENMIHRAVLFADGNEIRAEDIRLPDWRDIDEGDALSAVLVGRTVADVERDLILQTLHHCSGNRTQAADILGISVRTLRNKIKQYLEEGADVPAFSRAA